MNLKIAKNDTEHANDLKKYRGLHLSQVIRDKESFSVWYDKASAAVMAGDSNDKILETLSPWGCGPTQSNGVQAGMLQTRRLRNYHEDRNN